MMIEGGLRGLFYAFLASSFGLLILVHLAPTLEKQLSFPSNVQSLVKLSDELVTYKNKNPIWALILFANCYLYIQAFCIPGTFVLNLLAGAIFGSIFGSILACLLTTIGSSICFLLSSQFAKSLVLHCFNVHLESLRHFKDTPHAILPLLSARIFPFSPHWLINICTPFVDVTLKLHIFTITLGLLPYNVLCVRAGAAPYLMEKGVMNWTTLFNLLFIAVALLLINCANKFIEKPQSLPHHRQS